ncbi:MAG: VOC family protein [Lewinellaceae bacterium]|nr:VOC family protein [Phaeodactylibacter sp.]MCB9351341.1 VOC family protein [Lewinellaceae bacterium]
MNLPVDHLIYAAPTLERGMGQIEALLGARPVYGGQHLGYGTHNALLGLGPDVYLEVIAPDPAQPEAPRPLWIAADAVTEPRLICWAAKSADLDALVGKAHRHGIELGKVTAGSRARPDGQMLSWRLTDPRANPAVGIIPFFIDWGDSAHPAQELPGVGALLSLEAQHPEADRVQSHLRLLGLALPVYPGPQPALLARIRTRGGEVVLK